MGRIPVAYTLLLGLLAFAGGLAAEELSPDEAKAQAEFKKAYVGDDKTMKLKALDLLDGGVHPSTRDLLLTVVRREQEKELRVAALARYAKIPAGDPRPALAIVELFNAVKLNDVEGHLELAGPMKDFEFKYAVCEALAAYGSKLRYQDLVTGYRPNNSLSPGSGGSVGDPNVNIRKQREEFEKYVSAFNKATGAAIAAKDKESPKEFLKWWQQNMDKLAAADRELMQKYRAEELARLNTKNPLLPAKK